MVAARCGQLWSFKEVSGCRPDKNTELNERKMERGARGLRSESSCASLSSTPSTFWCRLDPELSGHQILGDVVESIAD